MALVLAPIELSGSQQRVGVALSPITLDVSQKNGITLDRITLDVSKKQGAVLGNIGLSEAIPSSTEITPTGGLLATGDAVKQFVLNGVPSFDATSHVIDVGGGMVLDTIEEVTTIVGYGPDVWIPEYTSPIVPGYFSSCTEGYYTFTGFDPDGYSDDYYWVENDGFYWYDYGLEDYDFIPLATLTSTYGTGVWTCTAGVWVPPSGGVTTPGYWQQGGPIYETVGKVVFKLLVKHEVWPLGSVALTGTATDVWGWERYVSSGGISLTGAAAIESRSSIVGTLSNPLPTLRANAALSPDHKFISAQLPVMVSSAVLVGPPSINSVLPKITANFSAVTVATGALSASLPSIQCEAELLSIEFGKSAVSLPSITTSITAINSVVASFDLYLPSLMNRSGGGAYGVFAYTPTINGSLSAIVGTRGGLSITLSSVVSDIRGLRSSLGTVSQSLPSFRFNVNALVGGRALVSSVIPLMRSDINALTSSSITVNARLPELNSTLDGYSTTYADVPVELTSMRASLTARRATWV